MHQKYRNGLPLSDDIKYLGFWLDGIIVQRAYETIIRNAVLANVPTVLSSGSQLSLPDVEVIELKLDLRLLLFLSVCFPCGSLSWLSSQLSRV